jgi:hypothetical protein
LHATLNPENNPKTKYTHTNTEKKRGKKTHRGRKIKKGLDWTVYGGQRSGRSGRTKNA